MRFAIFALGFIAALTLRPDLAAAQSSTTLGVGTGAVAGAIVAGPIGAVVGGVAGGFIGSANEPRRYRAYRGRKYGHHQRRRVSARYGSPRVIYSNH